MSDTRSSRVNKFFTASLLLGQILIIYNIGPTKFTLSDLFLLAASLYALVESIRNGKLTINLGFLPYFLYIILHLFISLLIQRSSSTENSVWSTLRYLLYVGVCVFFVRQYFDVEFAVRFYKFVCIASTAYLIIQTFCIAVYGFYPKGVLITNLFPIAEKSEVLYTFGDDLTVSANAVFRPRSFFSEPAGYAEYVLGYLVISMFWEEKKSLSMQLFLTLGLLLSVSSTGILVCIALWGIYLLCAAKNGIGRMKLIVLVGLLIIAIAIIIRSQYFKYFVYRFTSSNSTRNRFAGYGTIGSYMVKRPWRRMFGYGIEGLRNELYIAGFGRLYLFYGIVGTSIFVLSCLFSFLKGNRVQRMMLFTLLVLQLGTECLFGIHMLCYMPFVLARSSQFDISIPLHGDTSAVTMNLSN